METIQEKGKICKIEETVRRCLLAAVLLFVMFAVGGCGKGDTPPEDTPQTTGTPEKEQGREPGVTEEPGKEPGATEVPGITGLPEKEPEGTLKPGGSSYSPEENAAFAMVTPVPQEAVRNVRGAIAREDFPVVDGSTATIPLSEALYRYATGADEEEAALAITHTKTTNSYQRLYAGEADLLIVYEPSGEIVERMKTEELLIKPIGLDALVFMANAANPVNSLTLEQLVNIYSGAIDNWAEVGGEEARLLAFQRPSGSGSQTLMQKLVMGDTPMEAGDNVYRYSTMSDILEGMLSYNGEDNTLGYSVFYYANSMYHLPDLKFMGVNGVLPSVQTIYDGSYPLINAFYAVIRPDEAEDSTARVLFDWLTGEDGQRLILELGYVPVRMPEGAVLVDRTASTDGLPEVMGGAPLAEGEYYVLTTPQTYDSEGEYGNVTVFRGNWEVCARFYHVTWNYSLQGRYKSRYLPVGQIRQDTEGEQTVLYGIYDLEAGEYEVAPCYRDLSVLNVEEARYAVLSEEEVNDDWWQDYNVIDAHGTILLRHVQYTDWIGINKRGNCYVEERMLGDEWYREYRIYDNDFTLHSVFYEKEGKYDAPESRMDGVEYYHGVSGYLLSKDGEVLLSPEIFLAEYGDGSDAQPEFGNNLYNLSIPDESEQYGALYEVKYRGETYLFQCIDGELLLLRRVPAIDDMGLWVSYSPNFYYLGNRYYDYSGQLMALADGTVADYVEPRLNGAYLLAAAEGTTLRMEEHDELGTVKTYVCDVGVPVTPETVTLRYVGASLYFLQVDKGIDIPNPYGENSYSPTSDWYTYLVFSGETLLAEKEGLFAWFDGEETGAKLFEVETGNFLKLETDSLYEDYVMRSYNDYVVIEDGAIRSASSQPVHMDYYRDDGFLQYEVGNYTYVTDYDGNVCVRLMNGALEND